MSTGVGTVTPVPAAPQVQSGGVSSTQARPVSPNATFYASGANASTSVTGAPAVPSPQVVVDPTSGAVITEFLSSNGALQTQVPSTVAVAYLRAGLTEEGLSRSSESPYQSHNAPSPVTGSGLTA